MAYRPGDLRVYETAQRRRLPGDVRAADTTDQRPFVGPAGGGDWTTAPSPAASPYGAPTSTAAPVSGVQPVPPAALGADPAYLAFLRASGAQDANDTDIAQSRMATIARMLNLDAPELLETGEQQREQIAGGFEGRGMFRSGAHEIAQARQRRGEDRAFDRMQLGATSSVDDLLAALVRQRAARARGTAEQGVDSADRLYAGGY